MVKMVPNSSLKNEKASCLFIYIGLGTFCHNCPPFGNLSLSQD